MLTNEPRSGTNRVWLAHRTYPSVLEDNQASRLPATRCQAGTHVGRGP